MSNAVLDMFSAQKALTDAQAAHEAQEREQKIKLLGDLRQQQHEGRDEYDVLELNLRTEDEQRQRLRVRVRTLQLTLSEHEADKPAVADYLKHDREVIQWQRENKRLRDELDKAEIDLRAVPQSDRLRYVKLGHDLQVLAYRIDVVLRDLDGSLGKIDKGHLNFVS